MPEDDEEKEVISDEEGCPEYDESDDSVNDR